MYGDSPKRIPKYIFDEIRIIIKSLYDHGIIYPDITGYNFIECDGKIWIVDFGHAYFKKENANDLFVTKFIKGHDRWNPHFEWNKKKN